MFFFRSLGLAILVSAMVFHGHATAASIIAPLPSSVPQFQFVNGCGIGVHSRASTTTAHLYTHQFIESATSLRPRLLSGIS